MKISTNITPTVTILILILVIVVVIMPSLISFYNKNLLEGLQTIPLVLDASNHVLRGYYQVTNDKMALLPYGFETDPLDNKKIIPRTKVGISMLKPKYNQPIPKNGEKMPDGFYLTKYCSDTESCSTYDLSLAVLPPNMSPNLVTIEISGNPVKILYTYDPGYISETQYYENVYKVPDNLTSLPKQLYYKDNSHTLVSFLKYGQIQDSSNGFGAIRNPNLDLYNANFDSESTGYNDIQDNTSVQFHDDVDTIQKQNDMYDLNFGEVRVKDQYGNIVIIPRSKSQNSVTYYQPGEFPFGASTYVPNYEDSIYLSSVGNRTPFGQVKLANCNGACNAYNEFKYKMDMYCDK